MSNTSSSTRQLIDENANIVNDLRVKTENKRFVRFVKGKSYSIRVVEKVFVKDTTTVLFLIRETTVTKHGAAFGQIYRKCLFEDLKNDLKQTLYKVIGRICNNETSFQKYLRQAKKKFEEAEVA